MIYGKHIRLRAVERDDLPRFVQWLNDPEVIEGLTIHLPLSLEDENEWYEMMRKAPKEAQPLVIEIKPRNEWVPIGNCNLTNIDWRVRSAEFGIVIGEKSYWNQGYGTEALVLTLKHAFETLNLNRVALRVYEHNLRAQRAYEKAGLTTEGRLRQAHYHGGKYIDVLIMSILRSEWNAKREQYAKDFFPEA